MQRERKEKVIKLDVIKQLYIFPKFRKLRFKNQGNYMKIYF